MIARQDNLLIEKIAEYRVKWTSRQEIGERRNFTMKIYVPRRIFGEGYGGRA